MKTRKKGEVGNLIGNFRIKLLTSGVTMEGGDRWVAFFHFGQSYWWRRAGS